MGLLRKRTQKKSVKQTHAGDDVVVNTGRGGKSLDQPRQVSVQDSIVGGDTPPIDFHTLEKVRFLKLLV